MWIEIGKALIFSNSSAGRPLHRGCGLKCMRYCNNRLSLQTSQ
nr:MAG TPA: hypothetical protein [Caudoviricetes sp.]